MGAAHKRRRGPVPHRLSRALALVRAEDFACRDGYAREVRRVVREHLRGRAVTPEGAAPLREYDEGLWDVVREVLEEA